MHRQRIKAIVIYVLTIIALFPLASMATGGNSKYAISLNGDWKSGFGRNYTAIVKVPGIAIDPSKINSEKLWYKREVVLPKGDWLYATLELKGARFLPEVFVNGKRVSRQEGGMAPTMHLLKSEDVKPGNTITLEIALSSLNDVPNTDASSVPVADRWRSNVASCLWDDVILHLHGSNRIERIVPFLNFGEGNAVIKYDVSQLSSQAITGTCRLEVSDEKGNVLIAATAAVQGAHNSISISYKGRLKPWSPEHPSLYRLSLSVIDRKSNISDRSVIPFGIKQFAIKEKQFYLNNEPYKIRGGTVVWHRWMRSEEGQELGFDTVWFKKNIVQRLKDHGANYIRFHLGKPPERFLDLCDRYGMVVQYEWSFFHGMPASQESLMEQYRSWLDVAMRHPCIAIYHPYNETEGEQLKTVWTTLDTLLKAYPPVVIEDRDVIHIHKYWWGLFENVGLYYDDADQFSKALMVDEFGGNYLDGMGNLGGYKSLKESYLRFLGRTNTAEERLAFQAVSNAKIAEYWRRIDAAGFAPFCMLSSWEDGNNWFLGNLKEAKPMPVWNELTAAYSPLSVSLDIWDRNFTPAQKIVVPVYFFNDTKDTKKLQARITINDSLNHYFIDTTINASVTSFSKSVMPVSLTLPAAEGNYCLTATLLTKPAAVKYPVSSKWDIHVFKAKVPAALQAVKVAVPDNEKELKAFLKNQGIATVSTNDASAAVLLTSRVTWEKIAGQDPQTISLLQTAIDKGASVVMLDAGDRYLGQGYPSKAGELGPLQSEPRITDPKITSYDLFKGVSLTFTQAAEPETYLHADKNNDWLWAGLPKQYTWFWNGMRGGLLVPAADMSFTGLSSDAFVAQWAARGADPVALKDSSYYAYELQGFYGFSSKPGDASVQKSLKDKVTFLVEDAPALANSINISTPVKVTNLSKAYLSTQQGQAQCFTSLANCGKNLTRTPAALIDFGRDKGKLLVSQLLTKGRLVKGFGEEGFYGIRYDEAAVQMVLNMIGIALKK